jgi:hypothetical protein
MSESQVRVSDIFGAAYRVLLDASVFLLAFGKLAHVSTKQNASNNRKSASVSASNTYRLIPTPTLCAHVA